MTLLDLFRLCKRYLALIIALPVVLAIACAGVMVLKNGDDNYQATAHVLASGNGTTVVGLVQSEVRVGEVEQLGMTVDAKVETGTSNVAITVTGPDANACVQVANDVAERANAAAIAMYAQYENPYKGSVEPAIEAEAVEGKNLMKYVVVAFLAGLFLAVCIVVIIDMLKRPVKSAEGVQDAIELPVLEMLPVADGGERLLANVRFASGADDVRKVLVVPAGDAEAARQVADLLVAAAAVEGADVSAEPAEPLSSGMAAAYASRDADAVVVTAAQWADSLPQLQTTVAELQLASAKLVGAVFKKA